MTRNCRNNLLLHVHHIPCPDSLKSRPLSFPARIPTLANGAVSRHSYLHIWISAGSDPRRPRLLKVLKVSKKGGQKLTKTAFYGSLTSSSGQVFTISHESCSTTSSSRFHHEIPGFWSAQPSFGSSKWSALGGNYGQGKCSRNRVLGS